MESKVNYTVVGIFVVVFTCLMIFFILWLGGANEYKKYHSYLIIMHESVSGLTVNSAVKYNGVNVGTVKSITLNNKNPNYVSVLLDIEDGTPIKVDTHAVLMSQGLTGLSFVNLSGGSAKSPLLHAVKGAPYPVIKTEASLMMRLDNTVRQLSVTLTSLSDNVRQLINKDNQQMVAHSLQNLDKVTTAIANNSRQIDESIQATQVILKNTAAASKQLPQLINNLNTASLKVTDASKKLATAGVAAAATLQDSHAFIQTVTNQALPQLVKTLTSLQSVTGQVKDLAGDLKQNPAMLLRGREPIKPGPGE